MKKKILTITLCLAMISCLAACGKQADEPKETASQESSSENKIETVEEPASEEPEQVELTADTIDKYFGFEYTDAADETISGFSVEIEQPYGTEVIGAPKVPVAYSASGCPSTADYMSKMSGFVSGPDFNDALDYKILFDPCTALAAPYQPYAFQGLGGLPTAVRVDGSTFDEWNVFDAMGSAGEVHNWASENAISSVTIPDYDGDYVEYPIMAPDSVLNVLNDRNHHVAVLVANHTPNFITTDDAVVAGFVAPLSEADLKITVGELITADSTIEDVVAKYAPTEGTMLDNGAIVLTWKTAEGTTTEITFSSNEYKAMSVKILAPDMTPEILQGLGLN